MHMWFHAQLAQKILNAIKCPRCVELRNEQSLTALQRVEAQINEKRMENPSRPQGHPRSANLHQLYHEAIPMDKALSHSGPSAFGNGLLQHPVSQFILLKLAARHCYFTR